MPPKTGEFNSGIYSRITALLKVRFNKLKSILGDFSTQSEPLTSVQIKQLTAFLTEIKKKKADFDNNLQRVLSLPSEDSISDETLSSDQDEVETSFALLIAQIEVLTPPVEPKTPSSVSDVSTFSNTGNSLVRLPKIDLQKFSGDPLTWTSFINLFDTTIHRNASLSGVAKFQYLLSVLQGDALNLVKSLTLSTPNYLVAYNLLRDRYHNTRRLQSLHLNELLDLPVVSASSLKGLRQFVNTFTEHSQALKALGCDVTHDNPLLSALLLRKLNHELCKKLEVFRHSNEDNQSHSLPSVEEIIKFLNVECAQTEDANIHNTPNVHKNASSRPQTQPKKVHFASHEVSLLTTPTSSHSQSASNKYSWQCFACNKTGHRIYACDSFKNKSPQERYALIKQHQRCFSCLGNHNVKDCQSQSTCHTCNKRHHTLLHFDVTSSRQPTRTTQASSRPQGHSQNSQRAQVSNSNSTSRSENTTSSLCASATDVVNCSAPNTVGSLSSNNYTVLIGTTLIKLTTPQGTAHVFRALLDTGSMCELISERAANVLNVRRHASNLKISGLSQRSSSTKGTMYLNVETLSGQRLASTHQFHILDKLSVDLPRTQISSEVWDKVRPYTLADPTFHLPGGIDVIIGSSLLPLIFTQENLALGPRMPHLIGTRFGYVLMGQAPCATPTDPAANFSISLLSTTDDLLHSSLQKFWQQEEPPMRNVKSHEELWCDDYFKDTHTRDSSGRYIVRLPFKTDPAPALGFSKPAAEKRLHSLEQKFRFQPHFSQLYRSFMSEYNSLGHMVKIEHDPNSPHYFLPHHGVLKDSSTTKLRTVFDASSKTSSGNSLNDVLLTGRKLQTDICDIILNFRSHKIVFSCDIRQMYRQIKIHPEDQPFQLILWRDDPTHEISVFKLTTVTYGMNSSPYLAIKTLHQLADDEGSNFPQAAYALRHHTYVDDIVTGAESVEDALALQNQLIQLLGRGGFELRKWASNSNELLGMLPCEHLETPRFLQDTQLHQFSILGLHWSPDEDIFRYTFQYQAEKLSKRSVLSCIAKLYDPCGFLAPLIMIAKCYMQLLWAQGLTWDEPLPLDLADKWHLFVDDTNCSLSQLKIPRAFSLAHATLIQLHGFSDASECGYAAVVYFRCESPCGQITVTQIMSKTRVAPLKKMTLPRLELCGAHLLAKLIDYCRQQFSHLEIADFTLWSDSSVVLTWLQTPPYRLKTFVANRVAQTQELVPSHHWRHVKGTDNPADCASRGVLASQLVDHPLWWHGPSWLSLGQPQWPSSSFTPLESQATDELKITPLNVLTVIDHPEWELLSKYSSWTKLTRVMAYVLRFTHS